MDIGVASLEQIKKMRESLERCNGYLILIDDRMYDSFSYFIIWDDDNQIVYMIKPNIELDSELYAPFKILSFTYYYIESVTGIYSDGEVSQLYEKEV